ncbi:tRNA pseudouridine(55) synthase TruB [Arthrobacter terrae]|uniref:tRNA pseudouridine(55) synthase TruB n=1 Tax=Arthrobacter terrae TaxID=2935737 RepID=UPI0028ADCFF0|nr:tRNA pseudouridine(55) synthase TruB [Arthrobacter terrae]
MHSGLIIVDKPPGLTSHDVVARLRRLTGTRKVGHAGTLDPMATGVLVIGINKATRLLTYIVGTAKTYRATIRLGASTLTDDAEGEITGSTTTAPVTDAAIHAGIAALTGEIMQVPSSVSAIKVKGERAYARVRAGEDVVLAARGVTVHSFQLQAMHRLTAKNPAGEEAEFIDLDVTVECSSGTYIRALARDLGAGLGVGGHLTALRRTRVGPYDLGQAKTLEQLEQQADNDGAVQILDITDAARALMPVRELTDAEASELSFGRWIAPSLTGLHSVAQPAAAFRPDGELVALLADAGSQAKPVLVFTPDLGA